MDEYEYYKLGCKVEGERSIGRKRFLAAVARFERDQATMMVRIDAIDDHRKSMRLIVQWTKVLRVQEIVKAGKIAAGVLEPDKVTASTVQAASELADRVRDDSPGDDNYPGPDYGAPPVREPRRPIDPVLAGAGARPMPIAGQDAPAYPSWMST